LLDSFVYVLHDLVVGSSIKTRFEIRNSHPVLLRLPEVDFVDEKAGKPVGINSSSPAGMACGRSGRAAYAAGS